VVKSAAPGYSLICKRTKNKRQKKRKRKEKKCAIKLLANFLFEPSILELLVAHGRKLVPQFDFLIFTSRHDVDQHKQSAFPIELTYHGMKWNGFASKSS